jgi:hypothetical protein
MKSVYVEIIHTNGGTLGFGEPIGQADFYPNGGLKLLIFTEKYCNNK